MLRKAKKLVKVCLHSIADFNLTNIFDKKFQNSNFTKTSHLKLVGTACKYESFKTLNYLGDAFHSSASMFLTFISFDFNASRVALLLPNLPFSS